MHGSSRTVALYCPRTTRYLRGSLSFESVGAAVVANGESRSSGLPLGRKK